LESKPARPPLEHVNIQQGVRFPFAWVFFLPDGVTPEDLTGYTARVLFVPADDSAHRAFPTSGSLNPTAVSPSLIPNRFDMMLEDTDTVNILERSGTFYLELKNAGAHVVELLPQDYTVAKKVVVP
jgi:hypothetical protein